MNIEQTWTESIVPTLCDYITIPNKSPAFDPSWHAAGHMHKAVALLEEWARARPIEGMSVEVIELPDRTPTLIVEIEAFRSGSGTVLMYGHYDKQPEFDGWRSGLSPWTPVLQNERLYGRGGADDGYALFASLTAIEAVQHSDCPHARIFLLIEGCEESGSFDLPHYMEALTERIETPELVVCLDAECGDYDRLWVTTSLRGMLPGNLTVRVLEEGQHSGAAGGIVPSSFRVLRQLLERVENSRDGRLLESLYVDVPAQTAAQLRSVGQTLGPSVFGKFPWAGDCGPLHSDPGDALIANAWEPSLATVGLAGAPEPGNAGNTLRPQTTARLVFRLPPTLDARDAAETVKEVLEADPPFGAEVRFDLDTPQTGWVAPPTVSWLEKALAATSNKHFGQAAHFMGMGGTIPFMKMLGDQFPEAQFLVTGVLGPQSNAHGPNEFLHIPTGVKLTHCVADIIAAHAGAR